MQQTGQFKCVAAFFAHLHFHPQKTRQTGHAFGVLAGEGAFGIDDAGENVHQAVQVFKRHRLRGGPSQLGGDITVHMVGLEHEPEGLGVRQGHEGIHQLGAKPVVTAAQDALANLVFDQQDVSACGHVFQGQGVDVVCQTNAIGTEFDVGRQGQVLQLGPVGVVVSHHWRQVAQQRALVHQVGANGAVFTIEFTRGLRRPGAQGRAGNAAVMQDGGLKQVVHLCLRPVQ